MDHQIIRLEHYASLFHFWGFGGFGPEHAIIGYWTNMEYSLQKC